MIFILIYKFLGEKLDLSDSFLILGILELAVEFWLLILWSIFCVLKIVI